MREVQIPGEERGEATDEAAEAVREITMLLVK